MSATARIYRLSGNSLEQLTNDHRVVISSEQSYLGRALGVNSQVEIDHLTFRIEKGDTFVLVTDGIYEHVGDRVIARAIKDGAADLDLAAKNDRRDGVRSRQQGQSHRPDRPRR